MCKDFISLSPLQDQIWGVKLTADLHPMTWLKMRGAVLSPQVSKLL
jgi:hypothetical protein